MRRRSDDALMAEFYDSLIEREYTVTSLMELYDISRPTVGKWLKAKGIEPIPGSWPPRYTISKQDHSTPTVSASKYDPDKAKAFLEVLLREETQLDVAGMFRKAKTLSDMEAIIKGLGDTLATAHFYKETLMEDGLI